MGHFMDKGARVGFQTLRYGTFDGDLTGWLFPEPFGLARTLRFHAHRFGNPNGFHVLRVPSRQGEDGVGGLENLSLVPARWFSLMNSHSKLWFNWGRNCPRAQMGSPARSVMPRILSRILSGTITIR